MDVRLSLEEADPDVLRSLHDWLRLEPELRGRVTVLDRQPYQSEMGAVADVLIVAAGSGGALTVLASSLKTWFAQPKRSDVRIKIQAADGREVSVTAERVSRPEEIIREVLSNRDPE